MITRYFIHLSYDGTAYHGWQIQPNGISVQEKLQTALTTLLRQPTEVVGAGRTDAGVHARVMVAHFDSDIPIDPPQLAYRLNRILPRDISVQSIEAVPDDWHARFTATSRTYHYYLHTGKSSFLRTYSCESHYPLNFDRMNQAAQLLIGTHDFNCFCKAGADVKTTICHLTEAHWDKIPCDFIDAPAAQYCFTITANRFLRNMVRAVVGTLVDVGRGRLSLEAFEAILQNGCRSDAGESMPGNALFLWDVKYPPRAKS